ncbi:hypothetical protein RBI22_15275 [Alcaligenaceae bacterium C4P045]|nr:hypothetical protein [Alcaligenaceae bacterium C4P045]
MTYDEALEIGRLAAQEAIRLHGQDKVKVYEELRSRAEQDPELMEALGLTGNLVLTSAQAQRH